MLFDARTRSFVALGGMPRRGIYDKMKTAVDKVLKGKARKINVRFEVMCSHYLFERNRYSVPTAYAHRVVGLRIYPAYLVIVADDHEIALESGRPSGEHVLNVLGRLKTACTPEELSVSSLSVRIEPVASVSRYETLRNISVEANHVP